MLFKKEDYDEAYGALTLNGLKIKRGVEFGLTTWNAPELSALNKEYNFDYVIGSVHFVDGYDPYVKEYWLGKSEKEAFYRYLEHTLACVRAHTEFDVLGHLNYVCKSPNNPNRAPLIYSDYKDISDEIMAELVRRGKGLEINTSGFDRVGHPLPNKDFLLRFKELGGEIVTVGSDAHNLTRVGQYVPKALEILKDIFGYVCTFENRKPIFNKL